MDEDDPTKTTPGTPSQRLASTLRGLLAERRLKATDLATALDISNSAASRRLSGEHDFRINEIEALATWLDIPVGRLLLAASPRPA